MSKYIYNRKHLQQLVPSLDKTNAELYCDLFNQYAFDSGIDTLDKIKMFLTICSIESKDLTQLKESFNLSASKLMAIYPRFFNKQLADACERNSDLIADVIYKNRLGNISGNDGSKYIGRGLIKAIGYNRYRTIGFHLGLNLVDNPELLEIPENAVKSSLLQWKYLGLDGFAANRDVRSAVSSIDKSGSRLLQTISKYDKAKIIIK